MSEDINGGNGNGNGELKARFSAIREELNMHLVERSEEIDALLVGLIAQENVLFVGPPGTAKSLLAAALCNRIEGGKSFRYLMTKYTSPNEVFGPISARDYLEGRDVRITKGKLPEAHVAFLDEIFKSSSAAINLLLEALNERTYRNERIPLKLAVAASNEWPSGEESSGLAAAFDRFALRKTVRPVSMARLSDIMLSETILEQMDGTSVSTEQLAQATKQAAKVSITSDVKESMLMILRELAAQGIAVFECTRRVVKGAKLVRAMAWLNGRDGAALDDLEVLRWAWWATPSQEAKCRQVVLKYSCSDKTLSRQLTDEADSVIETLSSQEHTTKACVEACKKLSVLVKGDESKRSCCANIKSPSIKRRTEGYITHLLQRTQKELIGVTQ